MSNFTLSAKPGKPLAVRRWALRRRNSRIDEIDVEELFDRRKHALAEAARWNAHYQRRQMAQRLEVIPVLVLRLDERVRIAKMIAGFISMGRLQYRDPNQTAERILDWLENK